MPIEQQSVCLQLAQRMKELGVIQRSYFGWRQGGLNIPHGEWRLVDTRTYGQQIAAFTSAELGHMLPGNDGTCYFVTQKGMMGNLWYCTRRLMNGNDIVTEFSAETEADARAMMIIYLLENNVLGIKQ